MVLRHHASRAKVLAELHARPFVPLPPETRLLHFAFLTTPAEAARDRQAIIELAVLEGRDTAGLNERYLLFACNQLRWERHGEFVSYTFVVPPDAPAQWPENCLPPGELVVAVDLGLTVNQPLPP